MQKQTKATKSDYKKAKDVDEEQLIWESYKGGKLIK